MVPVPNVWVTLHRVGTDRAGPLDSVRTSSSGQYSFRYRRSGEASAIYFTSSLYGGVAYISKPLQSQQVTGDDAEIDVFDSTSRAVPINVRGRHVIVSATAIGGERGVTEVFDLSNDSSVTRIAAGSAPDQAVWSAILPSGAHHPTVAQGDFPADGVKFLDGRALVYVPMAPGIKQLVYSYTLSGESFPMQLPLGSAASVLELLLEEPSATAHGARLREVEPVMLQGRRFRRYLASDASASAVITVVMPKSDAAINVWYVAGLTIVIGGVMTVALARALRRR
jgi:hypothetical protein